MNNFFKNIEEFKELSNEKSQDEVPYFIQLQNFKKEIDSRIKWIEEFMLDANYEKAKDHLGWIGSELLKLYEKLEQIEQIDKEDCGCIQNISEEEFNKFLKSIGGLDNGWGERYWGDNKFRKLLFNVTNWLLYKLPYYKKSKPFSKENHVVIFLYNILYWIFKPILKDTKPRNPFRSMINTTGSFEIGPGWYGLVQTLIKEAIDKGWNKQVCQVKEKFGGLRFYINGASSEVHDIISKYESMSYKICEECGEPGKVRPGGWISTLCDNHCKTK